MLKQHLMEIFIPGQTKRSLNEQELSELESKILFPYPGVKECIDNINALLKITVRELASREKLYPCYIPFFIDYTVKIFLKSLKPPGYPVGYACADSIGRLSMQTLLNAFHHTGTSQASSGGIKEVTRFSNTRSAQYCTIHFQNQFLTKSDIYRLGPILKDSNILNMCTNIRTLRIEIEKHINHKTPTSIEEGNEMIKNREYFWYKYGKTSLIYTECERQCIEFEFDQLKLFSSGKSLCEISNIISSVVYLIGNKKNSDKIKCRYICLPSPTVFGIIHAYLSSEDADESDVDKDYFCQKSVDSKDFNINVCGIRGITEIYAISKNITSYIDSVEKKLDSDGNEIGTLVYLKSQRNYGIPIERLIHLLEKNGIKTTCAEETLSLKNLDFVSNKISYEKRKELQVEYLVKKGDENNNRLIYNFRNEKDKLKSKIYETKLFNISNVVNVNTKTEIFKSFKGNSEEVEHKVKNIESFNEILLELTDTSNENHISRVSEFFPKKKAHQCIKLTVKIKDEETGEKIKKSVYVHKVIFDVFRATISVNTKEVMSPNNYYTLNNSIIMRFCIKDLHFPKHIRLPRIRVTDSYTDNDVYSMKRCLVLDTLFPFVKNIIVNDDTTEEDIKVQLSKKPVDVLIEFLTKNSTSDDLNYVYAETNGTNLPDLLKHPLVDPSKTYSNMFDDIFNIFGQEALRNYAKFNLEEIIFKCGKINPEHIRVLPEALTCDGMNKFTSGGIKNQGYGPLQQMPFDNVKLNSQTGASNGNTYPLGSFLGIFLDGSVKNGSGYPKIIEDEELLKAPTDFSIENDMSSVKIISKTDNQDSILLLPIIVGKFRTVNFAMSFINKNYNYYNKFSYKMIKTSKVNMKIKEVNFEYLSSVFNRN